MWFCPGSETMNEAVNARISVCKLTTSARIILLFSSFHTVSHIINNLITPTVWSLRENRKPRLTVLTTLSVGQHGRPRLLSCLLGGFRFEYGYENEYENDFSILISRLHIITTHTHFIPRYPLCLKPT